ncbi:MAG TPA: maleylpyruvate isomerase N-terminal domain-containing protein [Candidatus Dormibacteraeota bacterium]
MQRVGNGLEAVRAALSDAVGRTARLIASIDAPSRTAGCLTWSLAETAAHMVVGLRGYADSVRGTVDVWKGHIPDNGVFSERLAGMTASSLDAVPERDPATLARLLANAAEEYLAATAGLDADQRVATPWYGDGASLRLVEATSLLLGEQLVHGHDLATTLGRPWPISRAEALMVAAAGKAMLPHAVNVDATRDVDLTYAVHLRGGEGFTVRVVRGTATIEPLGSRRADCHLSFDPVAFMLVGYGRISPWAAIARGQALAYGRRPWLGTRFKKLFVNP